LGDKFTDTARMLVLDVARGLETLPDNVHSYEFEGLQMNSERKLSFLLVFSSVFGKIWARNNVQVVFQLVYLQKHGFNALESVIINATFDDCLEVGKHFFLEQ